MKQPNIIQILVDDMGYGDLSRFNGGLSHTPVLDDFIEQSSCFSQCYAASPVCNPSRASIMTGRYPIRTGSIDTQEWYGLERMSLREKTLGQYFKEGGYDTGLIGKWHLGAFDKRYHPKERGFDETICFRGGMHDYFDWRLEYGHQIKESDGRYLTDVWTDEAIEYIHRHKNRPFFLHLAYNAPHTPLQVPEEELLPFLGMAGINKSVATLYAMIARLDTSIGRVLSALKAEGIEKNTLVMFTSDNGPQFDCGPRNGGPENAESLKRFNCNLLGSKGSVYEGGIKVPMAIRWPDGMEGKKIHNEMIHFVDLLPTLLSLAGIQNYETPNAIDGLDFSRLCLQGEAFDTGTRFWQWNRYTPVPHCNAAIRKGDWKMVIPELPEAMEIHENKMLELSMYNPGYFQKNGIVKKTNFERILGIPKDPELYNISTDPGETQNLVKEHPVRVQQMMTDLDNWFETMLREYKETLDTNG
jgi:arylsulfatase A